MSTLGSGSCFPDAFFVYYETADLAQAFSLFRKDHVLASVKEQQDG